MSVDGGQWTTTEEAGRSDAKRQTCCCHLISASRYHKAPERSYLFTFLLFLPNFLLVIFPFFAPLIVFFPQKSGARRLRLRFIPEYFRIPKKMACLQLASCTMRLSHTIKRKLQCCELQECASAKLSQYSLYKRNVSKKSTNESDKVWKTHNDDNKWNDGTGKAKRNDR